MVYTNQGIHWRWEWKPKGLKTVEVEWKKTPGERPQLIEIEGVKRMALQLALLALGFGTRKNSS